MTEIHYAEIHYIQYKRKFIVRFHDSKKCIRLIAHHLSKGHRCKPVPKFLANPAAVPSMRTSNCSRFLTDRERERRLSPRILTLPFASELHTLAASCGFVRQHK